MVLMTNSMLTTLNNSALKISLKDKHVGYVLYSGRAMSSVHRKVQTSPAWLLFCDAFPTPGEAASCSGC